MPPPPAPPPVSRRRPVLAAAAALGIVALSGAGLPARRRSDPLDRRGRRRLRVRAPPAPAPRSGTGEAAVAWHDDVDVRPIGPCGKHKCFFRSLADPSRGYLVARPARAYRGRPSPLEEAVRAYEYALGLEGEFGIRHLLAAPPFEAEAPDFLRKYVRGGVLERGTESTIVQPSYTAPEGSVVVKCSQLESLGREPADWNRPRTLRVELQHLDDEARTTLLGELRRTAEVVSARPELLVDFQLMIDPTGQAYHLDFERAFVGASPRGEAAGRSREGGCLGAAIAYLEGDDIAGM